MKSKIVRIIKWLILLEDYDKQGLTISARENKIRAAVHFLFPSCLSLLLVRYDASNLVRYLYVLFWGVYVLRKEFKESAWQSGHKTRSDLITKLSGLVWLWL